MKILPYFTPWDYLCDRTRVIGTREDHATTASGIKLPGSAAKLKFLLQEMNDLAEELSLLVKGCCDVITEDDVTGKKSASLMMMKGTWFQ